MLYLKHDILLTFIFNYILLIIFILIFIHLFTSFLFKCCFVLWLELVRYCELEHPSVIKLKTWFLYNNKKLQMLLNKDLYSPYIIWDLKNKSEMTQSQKDALTRSRTGGPANKLDGKAGGYRYPINACVK